MFSNGSSAQQLLLAPPPEGIVLRPYQVEALKAIATARDRGVKRQLVVAATGLGKAVIAAHAPTYLGARRTLFLAHREELIDQAARQLRHANPGATVAIEQAWRNISPDDIGGADIVVASIPTVGPRRSKRLGKFPPNFFDLILHDESHRAPGATHLRVLKHFGVHEPNGPLLVGWTATPGGRTDGADLANIFDEVVWEMGIADGMEQGWLSRARAIKVRSATDLRKVHTSMGDFALEELALAIDNDYRNSLICNAIEQYACDRNHIVVFALNVAHAKGLADQLVERGHRASVVLGVTTHDERQSRLQAFRDGAVRILVTVGVLTEGVDIPVIDCLVFARPTKSLLLYTQCLGRALRPSPGKTDALIVDVVDTCGRHAICTAATLFGMREIDLLGRDVLEASKTYSRAKQMGASIDDATRIDAVEREIAAVELRARGIVNLETTAKPIDLFRRATDRAIVDDGQSLFPWVLVPGGEYVLQLDWRDDLYATLRKNKVGLWECWVRNIGPRYFGRGEHPPFRRVDGAVKQYAGVVDLSPGQAMPRWRLIQRYAAWRKQPATPGQCAALARRGLRRQDIPPNFTKVAASDMLSALALCSGEKPWLTGGIGTSGNGQTTTMPVMSAGANPQG